jgi:RND family efflux transporter MFP subunit
MRETWFIAAGMMAALLFACEPPKPAPVPSGAPATSAVAVVRLKPEKVTKLLRLTAELQAYRSVALFPKVPGFLEWIGVDRGSRVKTGEALVRLIAPEIAAQKQEAEAKLAGDEATYKRLKEASGTPGVVAGNDLDLAAKVVDASRARVRVLSEQLSYLELHAPFDGVITERNSHEGSFVGPPSGAAALPVLRLQEVSKLRLTVAVPELAAGEIPSGKKVDFAVAAFPGEGFSGTVARSANALDPRTRTLPVELDVDNSGGRLTPGMFAEVLWPMERAKASYFVPPSCVATTTERSFVVRIRDGVAEWVDVKAGFTTADRVEIFGNLQEGDLVAIRGTDELKAGTKVVVQEPGKGAKP